MLICGIKTGLSLVRTDSDTKDSKNLKEGKFCEQGLNKLLKLVETSVNYYSVLESDFLLTTVKSLIKQTETEVNLTSSKTLLKIGIKEKTKYEKEK